MPRGSGTPGDNVTVNIDASGNRGEAVCQLWPKDWYAWTDRTGITTADETGPLSTSTLTPVSTGDAGSLLITADSDTSSSVIGLAVVLWDERGNPIGVGSGSLTTSGWLTNSAGNYLAANGYSIQPGTLVVDVSQASGYTIIVQSIIAGTWNLHWRLF